MTPAAYVHGYQPREQQRLHDQASALERLLHADTHYPAGSRVLEAGCGVGAQTVTLARRSPGAHITAIDIDAASVVATRRRCQEAGLGERVQVLQADLMQPPLATPHPRLATAQAPFPPAGFDHVFVCFVLEHLPRPQQALVALRGLLRPGGTLTVIEGDHGTTVMHPEHAHARAAVDALVQLQRRAGGDALIGRRLYPLLAGAGFADVRVSPRQVYADGGDPALADAFTRRTFAAMVEGVRREALAAGLLDAARFDAGVQALHRAAEEDGSFSYTFFKAVARRPG
jgi:SAM-dependent methyltransferase